MQRFLSHAKHFPSRHKLQKFTIDRTPNILEHDSYFYTYHSACIKTRVALIQHDRLRLAVQLPMNDRK